MSDVKREWFEVDYYKVLGVSSSATTKEISSAYRKLARANHPDANPGNEAAEERFKEISAAYDVVGDESRRKEYDQVRRMGPMGGTFGGGAGRPGPSGSGPGPGDWDFEGMGNIGDLLGGLFGAGAQGGRRPNPARPGANLEARLDIEFAEAVSGLTTTLRIGADRREVRVKIPAGIESGQKVRLRGKGGPGSGGAKPGDLLVTIGVGSHDLFDRSGRNLTLEAPITFGEAALGADVTVPTFDGSTVTLRIPPGTQSGRTFRVKEKGIVTSKGTGDLLITVVVHVPENLSGAQREALDAYLEIADDAPRREWSAS